MSHKYAYNDWVVPYQGQDRDGNNKKRKYFVPCNKSDIGATHRTTEVRDKCDFTVGYILAWFGIVLYHGVMLGASGSVLRYWQYMPYGVYVPMVQNCMNRDIFIFVRRYIHFADNDTCKEKNDPLFDPLYKVRGIMDKIMCSMKRGWIAGQRITIDESMIKYMGRAVTFVQYMPAKPIKHGIHVFACCCAVT